jgi:hypothetical protein
MTILTCPVDGQKLRIPDGKRGTVKCPSCGAQWFYPETIEFSDVEFRCAKNYGARFNVISERRSPLLKFTIKEIKKAAARTKDSSSTDATSASRHLRPAADAPSLRLGAPSGRGLLDWIWGSRSTVDSTPSWSDTHAPTSADVRPRRTASAAVYDVDQYDWSGFSCPYCNASDFVHCPGNGNPHLVCGGTIESRNGRRFHRCFCGTPGFIEGTITTIEDRRSSHETERDSPKLTAQDRQQLPRKPGDIALSAGGEVDRLAEGQKGKSAGISLSPPVAGGYPVKR